MSLLGMSMNFTIDGRKAKEYLFAIDDLKEELDAIVELASAICNSPISHISILDQNTQWFTAKKGIEGTSIPLSQSLCVYAMKQPDRITVVTNAAQDSRFMNNPWVTGETNIRFYAGTPLVTEDRLVIGTLCVADSVEKSLNAVEERMLWVLARRAVKLLELRRERNRIKANLLDKEADLERILQRFVEAERTAQIGSWEWDIRNDKFYWSPQMYELFGVADKSRIITKEDWQKLIHPADLPAVRKTIERGIRGQSSASTEYRAKHEDGKEIWLLGNGRAIYDSNGKVHLISGTALNITEQKRIAEQNKQQSTFINQILSHQPVVFYISEDLNIPFITENVSQIVGFTAEEFKSGSVKWIDRIHPLDLNKVLSKLEKIHETGSGNLEYRWQAKDNTWHWFLDHISVTPSESNSKRICGTWVDITDITEKEEELAKANVDLVLAEEEERARIAYELHDGLLQLLASAKLYLSVAKVTNDFSSLQKTLDEAIFEARAVTSTLFPKHLIDRGLLSALKELFLAAERSSGVSINFKYSPSLSTIRLSDTIRFNLYRLIQESLNNTIKHAGATEVTITFNFENENLIVIFSDNGKGLDSEAMGRKSGFMSIKRRIKALKSQFEILDFKAGHLSFKYTIPLGEI